MPHHRRRIQFHTLPEHYERRPQITTTIPGATWSASAQLNRAMKRVDQVLTRHTVTPTPRAPASTTTWCWPRRWQCGAVSRCPLYPQKRTFRWPPLTSAYDPSRTSTVLEAHLACAPSEHSYAHAGRPFLGRKTHERLNELVSWYADHARDARSAISRGIKAGCSGNYHLLQWVISGSPVEAA